MTALRAVALSACLLLAACGSIPVSSLIPLSRIDAQTTVLPVLRVAIRLPDGIRPRPQGVVVDTIVKLSGQPDRKLEFHLARTDEPAELAELPADPRPGFTAYIFRLPPDEIGRFDQMRNGAYAWRAAGGSASIGMGIATREFCGSGPLPAGPVPATTYLRTSELQRYIVVTKDLDLRRDLAMAGELAQLSPC